MKNLTKVGLAALMCTGFAVNAQAQDTCEEFTPAVYERWPHADDACLEIVTRDDGRKYAKFEAEVVSQSPSGTYVRYTLKDGGQTASRKVDPPEGFEAMIGGEAMAIKDLQPRQKVNVYLPEMAFASYAMAQAQSAAPPPPPPPPPPAPAPEPEPEPMMPTTAGSMGWMAIFGAMFLLLGGALRFARQQ